MRWLAAPEDHQEIVISATFASVCDRGLRHAENQDAHALALCEVQGEPVYVAVVCDGVSSSSAGAAASQAAVQAAQQTLVQELTQQVPPRAALVIATQVAQRAVLAVPWSPQTMPYAMQDQPPHTTVVMTVMYRGTVYYAWIGDSRVYWFTPSDAGCPVVDHSWINAEIARGLPRAAAIAEARRLRLSRALMRSLGEEEGAPEMVVPEVGEFPLAPGDIVLVCSDGLHIYGDTPAEMARVVRTFAGADAPTMARKLVEFAYTRGAVDNVTACVFQYVAPN
jgi:serine/threonine protein phosphatase PrpC